MAGTRWAARGAVGALRRSVKAGRFGGQMAKRWFVLLLSVVLVGCGQTVPTATPTGSASPSHTPTNSATPSPTPTKSAAPAVADPVDALLGETWVEPDLHLLTGNVSPRLQTSR